MQPQKCFITFVEKVLRLAHLAFPSAGRLVSMYSYKRKWSRDPKSIQESFSARERMVAEHQEVQDHLKLRAEKAAEREEAALSRHSEAEHFTRL